MNILNKLTIKHLLMNKKRTIVTIIGVLLSTALMVGIGLLSSSVRENAIQNIIDSSGSQHVIINNVKGSNVKVISNNSKVSKIGLEEAIGFSKLANASNMYKPYIYVAGLDNYLLSTLNIIDGNLPKNDSEIVISQSLIEDENYEVKIGDTITLDLGSRILAGETISSNYMYDTEETLVSSTSKTYKVVGIIGRSNLEDGSAAGYSAFTKIENTNDSDLYFVYVNYDNPKDAYKVSNVIARNLGFVNEGDDKDPAYKELSYNSSLLSMYGVSTYDNFTGSLTGIILIVLALVSVGCMIVIYNSFAISVMERKKQFGLFSSIGTTKKQISKTVFFESFIIGMIGIPLGILSSFFGIWVVIEIINSLLPEVFSGHPLVLDVYPLFIIIPIIFMILVILLSAFIPARMASRVSPIEAIRGNDDIKIKGKKVRTNKLIRKIFGIEGEIALKNIKRSRRKYRITILSLFISIVLFISFSGFLYYGFTSSENYLTVPSYDIAVNLNDADKNLLKSSVNTIVKEEQVDKYTYFKSNGYFTNSITINDFNSRYIEATEFQVSDEGYSGITILGLDNKSYDAYKKELGLTEDRPILVNKYIGILYEENSRTALDIKVLKDFNKNISLCNLEFNDEGNISKSDCNNELKNIYVTEKYPLGVDSYLTYGVLVIVSEDMLNNCGDTDALSYNIFINSDKYNELDKTIKEIENKGLDEFNYLNVKEELRLYKNAIIVIKILLYGFISLVTLIGVTSVFNTINTSIQLRRKEFAMLRSMGLTPKGFNKILYFESLLFGLKSLIYGIPVGIGVVYLMYRSFNGISEIDHFILPIDSIIIATVAVFIIIFITMMYASSKIKRENIIDIIREENI